MVMWRLRAAWDVLPSSSLLGIISDSVVTWGSSVHPTVREGSADGHSREGEVWVDAGECIIQEGRDCSSDYCSGSRCWYRKAGNGMGQSDPVCRSPSGLAFQTGIGGYSSARRCAGTGSYRILYKLAAIGRPYTKCTQVTPWWLRGTQTAYTSLLEGSSYRRRVGRMTDAERDRRWTIAKEHLRAAQLCFDHGLYSASATRSYYAAYQTIWVAVGDPPLGHWRHHGVIDHFCRGQWVDPPLPLTLLAPYRQRLRDLYDWRTDADDAARPVSRPEANAGLTLTQEILTTVAREKGLPFP